MAEYLRPGVYVEEKTFGTPPVTGGSTSIGAFVGFSPRVKADPVFVTSWTDFVNQTSFGCDSPFLANGYLAYAMYGFFQNGGQSAYVVSATDGTEAKATISVANGTLPIVFTAQDAGVWGNALSVEITANADDATFYDVTVSKNGASLEVHRKLQIGADADNNFVGVINSNSKLISVSTTATTIDPSSLDTPSLLAGGKDGMSAITDANFSDAMDKFDSVDSINLLVVAESQSQAVVSSALAYAEKREAWFVADGGMNDDFDSIQTFKGNFTSDFGGLYFPWVQVSDPIGKISKLKYVPSAGHVAGEIARTDSKRGIFKAPAGSEAGLVGVVGLKTVINDAQQAVLNPKGINVIRAFPDLGIVVWGARTMANGYINVRRELSYVMQAILNSTKWAPFEPNDSDLWRKISNQVGSFLRSRWQLGAYQGAKETDAFFVKCDGDLNTQDVINQGQVISEVGVAIKKPGEFIIFRVGQWDGGGAVS